MERKDDKFKILIIEEINKNEYVNIMSIMSIIGGMIRENDKEIIDPLIHACVLALFDSAKKED